MMKWYYRWKLQNVKEKLAKYNAKYEVAHSMRLTVDGNITSFTRSELINLTAKIAVYNEKFTYYSEKVKND